MWKRWLVIAFCLGLILARYLYPQFVIDTYTIWLVAIAIVAFLLPDLRSLAPYIKRVRISEAEIELRDAIEKLSSEVEEAQEIVSVQPQSPDATPKVEQFAAELDRVAGRQGQDPRASLLLLSSMLEGELRKRLIEYGIEAKQIYSLRQLARLASNTQMLPRELLSALDGFVEVRNRVAHGEAFDVSDNTVYSLLSIGIELLRIVSAAAPKKSMS